MSKFPAGLNVSFSAMIVDSRLDVDVVASILNAHQHLPRGTVIWLYTQASNRQVRSVFVNASATWTHGWLAQRFDDVFAPLRHIDVRLVNHSFDAVGFKKAYACVLHACSCHVAFGHQ